MLLCINHNYNLSYKNGSKITEPDNNYYLGTLISFCGCLNILLTVIGILGNSMSIAIFSDKNQPASTKFQLIGLSIVDLLLLICFIPLVIIPEFVYSFGSSILVMDIIQYSFVYLYPWAVTFQTISVLILILITTERFVAVCFPIQAKLYWTEFWAKLALFFIFVLAAGFNFIRFWEYKIRPCVGVECCYYSTVAEQVLHKNQSYTFWYKFLVPGMFALLACIYITTMNVAIATKMWIVQKQYTRLTRNIATEHNIAKMMILIVAVFVLCYGLHIFMYFYEVIISLNGEEKGFTILEDISHTLLIVNSATTCFIYCMLESYRKQAKLLFKRCWGKIRARSNRSDDNMYEMVGIGDPDRTTTLRTSLSARTSNFSHMTTLLRSQSSGLLL